MTWYIRDGKLTIEWKKLVYFRDQWAGDTSKMEDFTMSMSLDDARRLWLFLQNRLDGEIEAHKRRRADQLDKKITETEQELARLRHARQDIK